MTCSGSHFAAQTWTTSPSGLNTFSKALMTCPGSHFAGWTCYDFSNWIRHLLEGVDDLLWQSLRLGSSPTGFNTIWTGSYPATTPTGIGELHARVSPAFFW
jgi:hypothetical protein